MTDTLEYPKTYSCCMRHSHEPSDVLVDGIHMNVIMTFIYFGSYAVGLQRVCLAAFITILVNSMYMITIIHPLVPKENEADEADEAEADEAEEYTNLSLKQREHGATKSKSLSDEADAVLYEKLYEIVEETRRRNDARSLALARTPTSSSLVENTNSDDEYKDMPPLIDANSILRFRGNKSSTNILDKNQIANIKNFLEEYNISDVD